MPEPIHFYLYHTVGCHLCDEAEALIGPLFTARKASYVRVDIANDDSLVELYGIRIPVLKNLTTGEEAGWPFDQAKVLQMLECIP